MIPGIFAGGAMGSSAPVDPIALSVWTKMTDGWDLSEPGTTDYANGKSGRTLVKSAAIATRTGPAGGSDAASDLTPSSGFATASNAAFKFGDRDFSMWGFVRTDDSVNLRFFLGAWQTGAQEWSMYTNGDGIGMQFYDQTNTIRNFSPMASIPSGWTFWHLYQNRTTNKIGMIVNASGSPVEWSGTGYIRASSSRLRISNLDSSTIYPFDGGMSRLGMAAGALLTSDEQTYLYNGGAGRTIAQIKADAGA